MISFYVMISENKVWSRSANRQSGFAIWNLFGEQYFVSFDSFSMKFNHFSIYCSRTINMITDNKDLWVHWSLVHLIWIRRIHYFATKKWSFKPSVYKGILMHSKFIRLWIVWFKVDCQSEIGSLCHSIQDEDLLFGCSNFRYIICYGKEVFIPTFSITRM